MEAYLQDKGIESLETLVDRDLYLYETNSPDKHQAEYFASQSQEPQSKDGQSCHIFTDIKEDIALEEVFQTNNKKTTQSAISFEANDMIQDCNHSSEHDGSVIGITSEIGDLEISIGTLKTPINPELTAEIRSPSSSGSPNVSTGLIELAPDSLMLPERKISSHKDLEESQSYSLPDFSLLMEDSTLTKHSPDDTICSNSLLNERILPDFELLGLGSLSSNDPVSIELLKQPFKIGCLCTDEGADSSSDECLPQEMDADQDLEQLQTTDGKILENVQEVTNVKEGGEDSQSQTEKAYSPSQIFLEDMDVKGLNDHVSIELLKQPVIIGCPCTDEDEADSSSDECCLPQEMDTEQDLEQLGHVFSKSAKFL